MAPTGNRFDRSGIVELQITDGVWMIRSCNSQCGVTIGGLVRGAQNLRPVLPAIGHQGAGVHSSASSAAVWNIKLVNNREQLSDNDDDCWELTPANVSWWKGVKTKYLLQLRPYIPIIYFAFNGDWDERNYVRRLESFWTINPCEMRFGWRGV